MGETTKKRKDSSPGGPGQASGGKGGTTSTKKAKVYTEKDIVKIRSDAAAETGRATSAQETAEGERDAAKKALESLKNRFDTLEAEVDQTRLAEDRGDPVALRQYQREQTVKKRERAAEEKELDLETREAALGTERKAVDGDKLKVDISFIAAKHGLEVEDLEGLGITDPEALEKVAEKLATGKGKGEGEDADQQAYQALETDEEKEAFVEAHPGFEPEGGEFEPDPGGGEGAGPGALTTESVEEMPTEKVEAALKKAEKLE